MGVTISTVTLSLHTLWQLVHLKIEQVWWWIVAGHQEEDPMVL